MIVCELTYLYAVKCRKSRSTNPSFRKCAVTLPHEIFIYVFHVIIATSQRPRICNSTYSNFCWARKIEHQIYILINDNSDHKTNLTQSSRHKIIIENQKLWINYHLNWLFIFCLLFFPSDITLCFVFVVSCST